MEYVSIRHSSMNILSRTQTLDSNEVSALYNHGMGIYGDTSPPIFDQNLLAGWHFEEGAGEAAADFSCPILLRVPTEGWSGEGAE
jgi:hypothetical protein